MPRPFQVTISGSSGAALAGTLVSTPWQPNHMATPFAVGIGVTTSSSLCMFYTVQHTFDPVFDFAIPGKNTVLPSAATWHNHTSLVALSCDADGNYAFPVIAIRIACTASSCLNSLTATFIQAGP